jgi:Protein of unknown function (DUF732)
MRSKNIAAAIVVAMGIGTGLAAVVAVPAQADPDDQQIDPVFLKALRDKGLRIKSDDFAVDLAHSTCDVLSRTGSIENALRHIQNATSWGSPKDISTFGSLAVQGYCPSAVPK